VSAEKVADLKDLCQKTIIPLQSTQLKFYKMAMPALTYACENWTINLSEKRKTESAEMRFLCLAAGYTLLDQKQSEDIHSELKIFNLIERIEKQKENWH
jgi:hypothetical protein